MSTETEIRHILIREGRDDEVIPEPQGRDITGASGPDGYRTEAMAEVWRDEPAPYDSRHMEASSMGPHKRLERVYTYDYSRADSSTRVIHWRLAD